MPDGLMFPHGRLEPSTGVPRWARHSRRPEPALNAYSELLSVATITRPRQAASAAETPRARTQGRRLIAPPSTHPGVDLVEQRLAIVQVEVLGQIAVRLLSRGAVQRHVERDQARALAVAVGVDRRLLDRRLLLLDGRLLLLDRFGLGLRRRRLFLEPLLHHRGLLA